MRSLEFHPADVVIFYDKRFPADLDPRNESVPLNRLAIVVDEGGALSIRPSRLGRRIERIPLQSIARLPNAQVRRLNHGRTDQVAQFFSRHADRPSHFEAGLRALHGENFQPLIAGEFFPQCPVYQTDGEYSAAWSHLKASLEPADCIFCIDRESRLSRFIAWSTDGAWSHVALHVGNGEIWESVTSGVRNGPIEVYKGRRYWVAAYRHCDTIKNPRAPREVEAAVRAHGFKPNSYNYRGALKFGWKAFRGDHSHALTPNSMVLQGNLFLVAHA